MRLPRDIDSDQLVSAILSNIAVRREMDKAELIEQLFGQS